jgi:phosphoglycerate dehydrogenase-like enzyme
MVDETNPDVVVLREGTEGLSMRDYADELAERLPDHEVALARTPAEERELVAEAPVVTGVSIDEAVLAAASNLRVFCCVFSGTDHLPTEALVDRGVVVTNAAGIHAPGIAEQALGYVLTYARGLHRAHRRMERREWRHWQGGELQGSTVTIVGLGAIGTTLVERLSGWDVHTVGVRYTPSKGGPTDEVVGFDDDAIHDAFARSDYVVLACPLTETTEHLVDEATLGSLEPHAVLVNVARGGVVDTDALVSALRTSQIRGAALDVTDPEPLPADHPLWTLENCLITPHVGGSTPRHWERMADIVGDNVAALESGGDFRNLVVGPE